MYDFLSTFHNISYSREICDFQSKIANFPHARVFNASAEWVPLASGYRRLGVKILVMGIPG